MKLIYVVYGIAFVTAIVGGVSQLLQEASFVNIAWPFFAAAWVLLCSLNQIAIGIQGKIIKLLENVLKDE